MAFSARWASVVFAILFGLASLLVSQAMVRGQEAPKVPVEVEDGEAYAAERLILLYEPGASEAAKGRAVERVAGAVEEDLSELDARVIEVPAAVRARPGEARKEALRRAKAELEGLPGVASVEYDHVAETYYTPNDAVYPRQYGLKKPGFPLAWGATKGNDGRGVRIGIVDEGIDDDHPDLRGKIVAQRDFAYDDGRAEDGRSGHGSHVAGIAAATTNNRAGIAGACPDCRLLIAKAMNRDGLGFYSDIADGIVWSSNNGAKVVNLSLGSTSPSDTMKRAIDYAYYTKGAVVVAAGGNRAEDGSPTEYPASLPNVIAVAATDKNDRRASYSSAGGWIDVAAPGVNVYSTLPGRYGYKSGTSMATPHVAALAGLLAGRGYTKTQIRSRILATATDLGPRGHDPYYGHGRINAARAVP